TATAVPVEVRSKTSSAAFTAGPQEGLLYAGLRAGLALPYECATGTCGTCKARRVSGVLINDWPEAPGAGYLKPEREEILLCQTRALSPCSFDIPGSANLAAGRGPAPAFATGVVERVERLT